MPWFKRWQTVTWDDGRHVHVIPLRNGVHAEDDDGDCACGTRFEFVPHPDGDRWIIIHQRQTVSA